VVKLLLSYGASADVVDDKGISPKRAALKAARPVQVRTPPRQVAVRFIRLVAVHGEALTPEGPYRTCADAVRDAGQARAGRAGGPAGYVAGEYDPAWHAARLTEQEEGVSRFGLWQSFRVSGIAPGGCAPMAARGRLRREHTMPFIFLTQIVRAAGV
jgi:hypothetical protein